MGERWLWGYFLANMAGGVASLLIPLYAYHLGGTAGDVGAIASLSSLAGVLGAAIWGKVADRTKFRKPFVILGFGGFGGLYVFLPAIGSVGGLIWLNALATFGWMAQAPVASLLVIERLPRADWERSLGRFNRYSGFGWMAGLALGAVWTGLLPRAIGEGWALRALGVLTAGAGIGAAVLAALHIAEPPLPMRERPFVGLIVAAGNFLVERFRYAPARLYYVLSPSQLLRVLQGRTRIGPELTLYFYGILLATMGFSVFFVPLPLYLRGRLGLQGGLVFALYILHHGMNAFAYEWARGLIARMGHRPVQALALLLRSGVFPLFSLLAGIPYASPFLLPIFFLITGFTWAFFQLSGMAIVSHLAPADGRGEAMGVYNALMGLGTMFGGAIGGFLADGLSYAAAFVTAGALVFLSLPIVLLESKPLPRPSTPESKGS